MEKVSLVLQFLLLHLRHLPLKLSDGDGYDISNGSVVDVMRKHYTNKINNLEECLSSFSGIEPPDADVYCNGTWDKWLCWPPTKAGARVQLSCPPMPGLIATNFAYRNCRSDGKWEGKTPSDNSMPNGYSNYLNCYTQEAREIFDKYIADKTPAQKQLMYDIVRSTRTLEICGLCLSLVATFLSLIIFAYFRGLKCNRTRIHKNLFVAIIVQVIIELILYIDQHVARAAGGEGSGAPSGQSGAIYDTPVFCEVLYALLEYTKTVKFMWMFIEGLYLHNMIAVSVFSSKPSYALYYTVGWGLPMVLTIAWAIPMAQTHHVQCWYGYYYLPIIWIIEAPRVTVIAVNLFFLLNIIRVLIMKLRETHTNEANRVRKAVKAAIVLLPLLGITNFVVMIEPQPDDLVKFGCWAIISHFLISFEGFFISLIYCFLNGEVQNALKRHFTHHYNHPPVSIEFSTAWRFGSKQRVNQVATTPVNSLVRNAVNRQTNQSAGTRYPLVEDKPAIRNNGYVSVNADVNSDQQIYSTVL
ncbi:PDF receptor isoform X2 [Patella vulgata]|uniref:PDF receptor isoform X2 n=1 Tax=Patella vulgata TaxID=6465 RepID=UPI0021804D7F|nr:PDF receptor isoform X2 [Patella vulgata]